MGLKPFTIGTVEVELEGIGPAFIQRHAASYGRWSQTNTLYFDEKAERWLGAKEFQAAVQDHYAAPWYAGWWSALWWVGLLVILIFYLSRQVKKANTATDKALAEQDRSVKMMERSLALSERAVALNEEANRLLQEIAEALKKGR